MGLPFSIHELNTAISNVNTSSSPGYDDVTYEEISPLSDHSHLRLLEYYNSTWLRGTVPLEWKTADCCNSKTCKTINKIRLLPTTGPIKLHWQNRGKKDL